MSEETHEELNPANETAKTKTPLELVKEQQARKDHSNEVLNKRPENDAELPGHGVPSDRRKHPQRIHYDNGRSG
ncbi:MAG TPA: hypothetical protein VF681_03390 [Abditibacteriaceae bacterium]|jgi:hypothetical protein